MNTILYFIKKELIITIIASIIFGVSFYLYQSQNSSNKTEEINELKHTIISQKKKLKNIVKEYKKEQEFRQQIEGLKIINNPITLDIYKEEPILKKVFYTFFGSKSIKVSFKPEKIKIKGIKNYVFYKVNMAIPYLNSKQLIKYFDYLTSEYFYVIGNIKYSTTNQKFIIQLYLLGKKGKSLKKHHRRR